MDLSTLAKIVQRSSKRIGRGYGSGKGGHTSSRGTKGQKARGKVHLGFEGTKVKKSFVKRLPLLRGKGRFKPWSKKPLVINAAKLKNWPVTTPVTVGNLVKRKIIKQDENRVKIVGRFRLPAGLDIRIPASRSIIKK